MNFTAMKKLSLLIAGLLVAGSAFAQSSIPELSDFEKDRLRRIGQEAAAAAQRPTEKGEAFKAEAQAMARRADTIANAALESDRQSLLTFLGIDPMGGTSLYFFVSFSMPIELLRSYAMEAMWSGGTLVFRGIPEGKDIASFITTELVQLFNGKIDIGSMSLDPRLFELYGVDVVPSIVLTRDNSQVTCTAGEKKIQAGEKQVSFQTCGPLDESNYLKISGAVSTDYALRQFIENGFPQAKSNLSALAKGSASNAGFRSSIGKDQVPFTGKWEDFITPAERKAAEEAAQSLMEATKAQNPSDLSIPAAPQ